MELVFSGADFGAERTKGISCKAIQPSRTTVLFLSHARHPHFHAIVQVKWPDQWDSTFIISVDGVHCQFHEVKHPTKSKDPAMYSHKFIGPGLSYELALSLCTNQLVWLLGP